MNQTISKFILTALLLSVVLWAGTSVMAGPNDPEGTPGPAISSADLMARIQADRPDSVESMEALGSTPCVGGNAGIYSCDNIDLMAFVPLSTFAIVGEGADETNDIWGWTDPMDDAEYAILGLKTGTAFFDISTPVAPIYLGFMDSQTGDSTWRDIKVYSNHAFVVSEASSHGMQIFDLTRLRSVVSPPVNFSADSHYAGFGNAHNIVINEDSAFAYAVGTSSCSGGLFMIDIASPQSPTFAGCFSSDGYTHDAQCVNYSGPDSDHAGAEVCFAYNEDTLTIVDVTNKSSPVQLSRTGYSGDAYTHQGWVTDDHTYLLLGDELDESFFGHNTRTRIWDISDLDSPSIIGIYNGPNDSIDHNLYILNGFAYMSNYTSGVQIASLADVSSGSMSQVAYFDTYTPNNSASFFGSWSNYPYFASGIVIATGIDEGMFILMPDLTASPTPTFTPTPTTTLTPSPTATSSPTPTASATATPAAQIFFPFAGEDTNP
jgi:choice-of-anchor B domain-containing protein